MQLGLFDAADTEPRTSEDVLEQAVVKIRTEMTKDKNPYVQVIGSFLLKHLKKHPELAASVCQDDKTILKSLDAMRDEARKKQVGGCAVLTDEEGYAVVLKYFGSKKPETEAKGDKKDD